MRVFQARAYGFDRTGFIIAAESIDEAYQLAVDADMGSVDWEDVSECHDLSTTAVDSMILVEF